jgi:DNA-binding MarR family transcriptional regulator
MARARTHNKRPLRKHRRTAPRVEAQEVVDETIALFHWLAWVADQLYGDDAHGAPHRWVMRRLQRYGPQTVPELARAKAQRRQSVQPIVDELEREGVLVLVANPQHVRSRKAQLTPRGTQLVERMDRIDAATLAAVSRGISRSRLGEAAATLRALREAFAIESRWRT